MADTKKIWRQRWLDSLNELTSIDLQKKSWLDTNNTNPHWSFVEFMNCYFDDLLSGKNYQYYINNLYATSQEYEILKEWHDKLNKYESPNNDDYDHNAILNDTNWLDIVEIGKVTIAKLGQVLNAKEKQILTRIINVA